MRETRRVIRWRLPASSGASFESSVERLLARALWRRGWRPQVVAYTGYGVGSAGAGDGAAGSGGVTAPTRVGGSTGGSPGGFAGGPAGGWVRVMARALLLPAADSQTKRAAQRGWRQFLTLSLDDVELRVKVGGTDHLVRTAGGGYLDVVLPWDGAGGWHDIELSGNWSKPVSAPVRIVGPDERDGVISDIDDTVMVTAIPRPLLAFWNSFVRLESTRKPVPGMPDFFERVLCDKPDAFVAYVSTGAWNVAPSITRFLRTNGYPDGPLLMTDWGPSTERWFRSGRAHKHATLRRLTSELPNLTWVLIGDDGQHDPQLYDDLICDCPGRVGFVAIRELTATEQVLTHGTPTPLPNASQASSPPSTEQIPKIRAGDGHRLIEQYERQVTAAEAGATSAP